MNTEKQLAAFRRALERVEDVLGIDHTLDLYAPERAVQQLKAERDEWREKALTDRAAWADENSRADKAEAEVERLATKLEELRLGLRIHRERDANGWACQDSPVKPSHTVGTCRCGRVHEVVTCRMCLGVLSRLTAPAGVRPPSVVGFDANGSETP